MNKHDVRWAYFAALIDGEGSIGNPKAGLHIQITDKNVVKILVKTIGGKYTHYKYRYKGKNKKCYDWRMSCIDIIGISDQFEMFLISKRRNLELWKEWVLLFPSKSNQFIKRRHERRQEIIDELRKITARSNNFSNSVNVQMLNNLDNTEPNFQREEEKFAYLAGIIDGEGSMHIRTLRKNNNRKYQFLPDIVVCNTDKKIIDWLYNNFGGRKSVVSSTNNKWKNRYYWFSNSTNVKKIIKYIDKYIIIKKNHLKQFKKFYRLPRYSHLKDKSNREYLTNIGFEKAKRIVATVSILNHKQSLMLKEGVTTLMGSSKEKIESNLISNYKK